MDTKLLFVICSCVFAKVSPAGPERRNTRRPLWDLPRPSAQWEQRGLQRPEPVRPAAGERVCWQMWIRQPPLISHLPAYPARPITMTEWWRFFSFKGQTTKCIVITWEIKLQHIQNASNRDTHETIVHIYISGSMVTNWESRREGKGKPIRLTMVAKHLVTSYTHLTIYGQKCVDKPFRSVSAQWCSEQTASTSPKQDVRAQLIVFILQMFVHTDAVHVRDTEPTCLTNLLHKDAGTHLSAKPTEHASFIHPFGEAVEELDLLIAC